MLALIGNLHIMEIVLVIVVAIMIFGRRLPQVAARAAVELGRLRRSMQHMWRETGIEKEIRDVQAEVRNTVPRDVRPQDLARIASDEILGEIEAQEEQLAADAAAGESAADHVGGGGDGSDDQGENAGDDAGTGAERQAESSGACPSSEDASSEEKSDRRETS